MNLCLLLRACRIPVVAVDSDERGESVGIAKEHNLPVVIGRGADPSVMRRLSLHKARAVVAATSDDLENISVAMTARGIDPEIRTVLRVGDGNVANETRSLLALGLVRDVHRMAASLLAAKILGDDAESVVCLGDDAHLRFPDGRLERARARRARRLIGAQRPGRRPRSAIPDGVRALVAGATGFIGQALCERLLRDGVAVRALVRERAAHPRAAGRRARAARGRRPRSPRR